MGSVRDFKRLLLLDRKYSGKLFGGNNAFPTVFCYLLNGMDDGTETLAAKHGSEAAAKLSESYKKIIAVFEKVLFSQS